MMIIKCIAHISLTGSKIYALYLGNVVAFTTLNGIEKSVSVWHLGLYVSNCKWVYRKETTAFSGSSLAFHRILWFISTKTGKI